MPPKKATFTVKISANGLILTLSTYTWPGSIWDYLDLSYTFITSYSQHLLSPKVIMGLGQANVTGLSLFGILHGIFSFHSLYNNLLMF